MYSLFPYDEIRKMALDPQFSPLPIDKLLKLMLIEQEDEFMEKLDEYINENINE
jgi:hypothetical protein